MRLNLKLMNKWSSVQAYCNKYFMLHSNVSEAEIDDKWTSVQTS